MSTPIYTATAGPVDPNAPIAQKAYTIVSGLLGLVGIAATVGLITNEQAASLGAVGTASTTLVGAVVTAVASFRTKRQLKNGTFDAPPPPAPPAISTAQQIANAIPAVVQAAADKQAEVDLIKQVASTTLGNLPVVGGLAEDLIKRIPSDLTLP